MSRFRTALLAVAVATGAGACSATSTSVSPAPSGAASPSSEATTSAPQHIVLDEWHVAVADTFKAGIVRFEITNTGTVEHELLVFKSDLAPTAFPKDSAGNIIEDAPGIKLVSDGDNIAPGKTQSRAVDLTAPGKYLFVCNIAGHFMAGMWAGVTVTP